MVKKSIAIFTVALFLQFFQTSHAQFKFSFSQDDLRSEYSLQTWTKNDGLPSNTLYNIIQGDDNFLWIGTSNGLVRFDGYAFKTFTAANTPQIKANIAADLFKDSRGRIWFTNGGAGLIIKDHHHFRRLSEDEGLSLNHPSAFAEKKDGTMFIGTFGGGLNIVANEKFTILKKENGLSSNDIHSVLLDKQKGLWIGTYDEGIDFLDDGRIKKFPFTPISAVEQIFQDTKGKIFAATHNGVLSFNSTAFQMEKEFLFLKGKTINHIDEDGEGNLWFSTSGYGIYVYNRKKIIHLDTKNLLPSDDISQVLITPNGVWICSLTEGLSFLKQNKVHVISTGAVLPDNNIRSIYQAPDDVIWIGTNSGIAKYDESRNQLIPFNSTYKNLAVHAWAANNMGEVFLGTRLNGLLKIVGDKIIKVADRRLLKVNYIRSLKFADDGTLWIGTNGAGIILLKNGKPTFIDRSAGLASDFIACICKDKKNNFWVGTSGGGISVLNSDGKILKTITDENGLANNIINSILEDEDGNIWVGTSVSGISRIKANAIFNFNERNGLYANTIKKLLYNGKGTFWVTSEQGVFTLEKNNLNDVAAGKAGKLVFNLFGKKDGMQSDEFNAVADNAGCISRSGKIYAPSNEGIVIIDPAVLQKPADLPCIYIDEVFVNNKEFENDSLKNLPPGSETIQINYGGISFLEGQFLKYKYFLEGIDKEWSMVGTRRQAYFTHLPHGKYTFKVVALTPDGRESKNAAEITFIIHPYFWQTLWFQLLSSLAMLLLVTFYLLSYFKRKYKRKVAIIEAEAALERERMRISKDMHDELGASLTKISLMSDLAKRDVTDPLQLKNDLDAISETSRTVASTMDEIVWAVNPKNDTLEKTIFYFVQYIEEFLSSTPIEFVIAIPDVIPEYLLHAELRHNLYLVIKEAVNNIVKHSAADTVTLRAAINNSEFNLSLEDNGKGIEFSSVDQFSNGLKNMTKRIEDINGKLEIVNSTPTGTKITITVPLK